MTVIRNYLFHNTDPADFNIMCSTPTLPYLDGRRQPSKTYTVIVLIIVSATADFNIRPAEF